MKFLYLANVRLPTEKAHGAQIMKTCEALAKEDMLAALVVSNRKSRLTEDTFAYYGVDTHFLIEHAAVLDTVHWGFLGFLLETFSFVISALSFIRKYPDAVLYGRDEIVLFLISLISKRRVVWESHTGSWNIAARRLAKKEHALVVISQGLKEWYVRKGVPAEHIVVAPDAVDLADFAHTETPEQARSRLSLGNQFIAMYVGRLDGWKGTESVCEASEFVGKDIQIVLIGGEAAQVAFLKEKYPKARFLGSRPYAELPDNLAAADALILPTSAKSLIGERFTSPMKLFAYLAAGKPIIATDIPAHKEILTDADAIFIQPDDPAALADALFRLREMSPEGLRRRGEASRVRAGEHTWEARASLLKELL